MDYISKIDNQPLIRRSKNILSTLSSISKSFNMRHLTDNNIRKIINDHNKTHENNTMKEWFNYFVQDENTIYQHKSSNDYKCKKVDASQLESKRTHVSLKNIYLPVH